MIPIAAPIDQETKSIWRVTGTTGAVGIEMAAAIAIGYLGGDYLDGKFGTAPFLKWIGFAGGIGAGIKALVQLTRSNMRQFPDDKDESQ